MKYRFLVLMLLFLPSIFLIEKNTQLGAQNFDINSIIDPNTGLPSGVTEQITIEQIPKIPSPGQSVSISITSFSTDLNKAQITWTQDGRSLPSGTGVLNNIVVAPESGKSSTVRISIQKQGGGSVVKTVTLSPAEVDLIYEAQTYTHPFYKGKKLFTSESEVLIIALPNFVGSNGQKLADSNLVYTWKINGNVEQSFSGYGKNTFLAQGSLIERPINVTVEVSAINSNLIASKTINLKTEDVEFVLYENNPILGVVYEQAIQGTFLLERPQVDFEGIPYFFSANYKDDPSLAYAWSINGLKVQTKSQNENYMLLRNENNQEGRAVISTQIKHANKLLQNSAARLELNFKKVDNVNNNEEFVF